VAETLEGSSSRYRLLGKIGQGAMGEVWAAEDASLRRRVALKFLPKRLQEDADARRHLIEEARSVASLNHPYICSVFEVGIREGTEFIAMEYVEGETLLRVLQEGALPLAQALSYGCEIAEALDHAHEMGIVHRDLKPSNIMVTTSGHIKVMDFGLAIRSFESGAAEVSADSTRSTTPGTAVGTLTYMSPEQVLGKHADRRSDVFSFGIMLYEMLTGVHPFRRPNPVETAHAILKDDPLPVKASGAKSPEVLRQVVSKMLAKQPELRYQSGRQILEDLQNIRGGLPSAEGHRRRGFPMRTTIGLLCLSAAIIAGLYLMRQRRSGPDGVPRQSVLIDWVSNEGEARISPDGKWFTFLSDRGGTIGLWRRALSGGDAEKIDAGGIPMSHAWSGDGEKLACLVQSDPASPRGTANLVIIPALYRETPQLLLTLDELAARSQGDLQAPNLVSWIGNRIYLSGHTSLWTLNTRTRVLTPELDFGKGKIKSLSIRPDEKKIVFNSEEDLFIADLHGENRRRLTRDNMRDYCPRWIRHGASWRILFSSNRSGQLALWELEPDTGASRMLPSQGLDEAQVEDCSSDGSVAVFRGIREEANLWSCALPGPATPEPFTFGALCDFAPSLSSGPFRIAFQRLKRELSQGSRLIDTEIYLAELGEKAPADFRNFSDQGRLQAVVREGCAPSLSPDGRRLAYLVHAQHMELRLKDLSTSREVLLSGRAIRDELLDFPLHWGPDNITWMTDNSALFFVEAGNDKIPILKKYIFESGSVREPAVIEVVRGAPGETISNPRVSSDGSRLAYSVHSGGNWEIRVREIQTGRDTVVFAEGMCDRVYCVGWLGQSVIALRLFQSGLRGDSSGRLDVLDISPGKPLHEAGRLQRAYGQTAVLDPAQAILYVTARDPALPNIIALQLSAGSARAITSNQRLDTTFSGLQLWRNQRIFYSQQKHVSDLYSLSFAH
jgi:Tol biopolymer transport system component/tRNA A-37 threonylcarbamoyl transferase component Bud32